MMGKRKATMVRAFPTPLTEVARYIVDNKIEDLSVKGVVTTGEPLYTHQREMIKKAFRCQVFDSYRTRENGPLAQECEIHEGQHINSECIFLEVIPFKNQGKGGNKKQGRILITDLLNYGMPFIRYEIGDVGILSTEDCACGRGLPLLDSIGGRLVDVVFTPDKRRIASITLIPNLVHAPGITNRVQFVQDRFDHLQIRMTKPQPPRKALQIQREIVEKIFGPKMKVSYKFVDDIPLRKSGKYSFVLCKIPAEKLNGLL
jgi:phenylacetate-CoA ligase